MPEGRYTALPATHQPESEVSVSKKRIQIRRYEQGVIELDYGEAHIRCGGSAEKPWFVANDVCALLDIGNARQALARLDDDEKGVITTDTPGGKQVLAVVYESGLYNLIFTSRKDEAKAFRKWVTSEVLPAIRRTGQYRLKQRERYLRMGKPQEWIEKREEGIAARNTFTDTLKAHGLKDGSDYARVTNALYYPTLGGPAAIVKRKLGLSPKANLRDNLPLREIFVVGLAELLAQQKIDDENRQGFEACQQATAIAADNVAKAVKMTQDGRVLPA